MPRSAALVTSVRHRFATLDRFGVAAEHLPAYLAGPEPPHGHDMVEMCFVLAGRAEHVLEGQSVPAEPGTLAIVHYGQQHRFRTDHGPMECVNVYLDPEVVLPPPVSPELAGFVPAILPLCPALVHARNRLVFLPFPELEPLRSILLGLCRETERQSEACPLSLRSWYTLLLTECARRARELGHRPAMSEAQGSGRIEELRLYLDAHSDEPHDLAALAAHARMTPTALCRAFKRHTGRTLVEYLHQRRIERAMLLLGRGATSVAEAALASGFQDLSHFNRVFRRLCGCSPRAWRKRMT